MRWRSLLAALLCAPTRGQSNFSLAEIVNVLQADLHWRLGPLAAAKEFDCDLLCGPMQHDGQAANACSSADRVGRVHIAFIVDSAAWLDGALASVVSILVTNGGSCSEYGAFHFHLVIPIALEIHARALLRQGSVRRSLSSIISVHVYRDTNLANSTSTSGGAAGAVVHTIDTPHSRLPIRSTDGRKSTLVTGKGTKSFAKEALRLNRASNFARFALPTLLPAHVDYVLYIDGDMVAVHGPIDGEMRAPLKRAYRASTRALASASRDHAPPLRAHAMATVPGKVNDVGERLSGAMAAVPGECTANEFARDFIHRQFLPSETAAEGAAKIWLRTWAKGRLASLSSMQHNARPGTTAGQQEQEPSGALCFNAGVFLLHVAEWRRMELPRRLMNLSATRLPQTAQLAHLSAPTPDSPDSLRPSHQPLWSEGTQRPMRLLFGGDYTQLPATLNTQGCGNSRIPAIDDLNTRAAYASLCPHAP